MKFVVTHPDLGVLISPMPNGVCVFPKGTGLSSPPDNARWATVFETREQASDVVDRWTDMDLLEVVGVDVDPGATIVSFDQLRAAGLGDMVDEHVSPCPRGI